MDNTTNNGVPGASSGGNFTNNPSSSPFGNGDSNPKPLPSYMGGSSQISDILKEATHPHDSVNSAGESAVSSVDSTPAFSGMPHAGGSLNTPHTSSASHLSASAPVSASAHVPTPASTTPISTATHATASQTYSSIQNTSSASPFASTIAKQTMSDYKESQKKIASSGGTYSHIYVWLIISLIVLALVGGGVYWYLFMGGQQLLFPTTVENPQPDATPKTPTQTDTLPVTPRPSAPTSNTQVRPTANTIAKPSTEGPFSGSDKDLVSQYIRKNINSLSPKKSSLGFTVSDIVFDGPNRAIVSYGNRSVSYSAAVNATVTNGVVKITSFTILEK